MSIIEREQTTLPDFETWPVVEEAPKPGTIAYEALRLDRLFPGWAERIDVEKLDIACPHNCILAQGAYSTRKVLFGLYTLRRPIGYGQGMHIVERDAWERNGGDIASGAYYARHREDAWKQEIAKRVTV